jgi:hypothetical protein
LGLPTQGEDPSVVMEVKDVTQEEVYKRYGTCKGTRGVVISIINDTIDWFSMKILSCKMM